MSYRIFPATSGPASSTAFGPGICQGITIDVTSDGMVLQGYFYWRADSSQSAAATFCLYVETSSTAGTLVSGSTASTSSGVTGQWNFVPLSPPVALTSGTTYKVVMGQTGNFSDTHPYFNAAGGFGAGITNGPLNCYADPGGTSNLEPFSAPQGSFTTGSSDPTVTFPTSANTAYNPWIDVQVDFAATGAGPATPGRTWLRRFRHRQTPQFIASPAAPAVATPPPLIVQAAATPAFGQPGPAVTARSSLQDFATPVTPAPNVLPAAATPGFGRPGPAIVSQAPPITAAAPAQATPAPLVVTSQPPAVPPGPAVFRRSSLADAPVLTTPAPVVVMATAVTPYGRPQAAVISSAPVIPAAAATVTPQPVIVAQAVKVAAAQPPVILRNTLADPPVLTTPQPVILWTQTRPPPVMTVILSAPFIPPPPPFQVARSTPTVTAAVTSGSTITDPRDGTASVTAAATSTPGVTDPRDGTASVTTPDSSSPTVT